VVEPALRQRSIATGESASFYAREGDSRACISRVEGPQAVRHHVRIGERLPLDKGAPGKVILAFMSPVTLFNKAGRERTSPDKRALRLAVRWKFTEPMCTST
jgi:DNA-binding IclR family transcriptional regulator